MKFNLDQATKIKNVNWIVKPHPLESRYPNAKTNTYKEFRKYNKFSNIKLMDGNFSGMTIAKSAKAIVSCFGTAPLEYASYGIPSIIAANARYSHLNIAINPKTIRKYKKYLNSIKYLKKLSKIQIDKANAQTFFQAKFIRVKLNLLPKFDGMAKFNEYSDSFWKDSIKNGTMLLRDIVDLEATYDMSDIGDTKIDDTLKLIEGATEKKDKPLHNSI